jgi:uncharacterized membrane protein HdeD (DUF308 family)
VVKDSGVQGSEASEGNAVMFKSLSMSLIVRGIPALAVGIIALAWPGPTALALVLVVGTWAVTAGLVEIAAAFQAGEQAGTRAMFIPGGLVTIAFGVLLCARPGIGAITLALLFGLFNLVYGTWALAQGIEPRRTRKAMQSAVEGTGPAGAQPSPVHTPFRRPAHR